MQIYEIFQPTSEGVLKGIQAAASAAGSALTSMAHRSLGTNPSTYQTKSGTTAANPYIGNAGKEEKMRQLLRPMAADLAAAQSQNWDQALKHFNVASPAQLTPEQRKSMEMSLIRNANAVFKVRNLLDFSRNIAPAYREDAEQAEKNIQTAIQNIMSKPPAQTKQDWNNFVVNAQEAAILTKLHSQYSKYDEPVAPTGKRIAVVDPVNKGTYYKDSSGVWTNEVGDQVKPQSIEYLEQLASQSGKVETVPPEITKPAYRDRGVGPTKGARRGRK